jgi:hypothetical protein
MANMMARAAATALLGMSLGLAPAAFAQSGGNNPAATVNGTVPTAEGNVWGGMDHQPTEAEVPQGTIKQQDKINHKLQTLDQQLMNAPLGKVPNGGPAISGDN